jgi:transcription factor STE12
VSRQRLPWRTSFNKCSPTPATSIRPPNDVIPRSLTEKETMLVQFLSQLQFVRNAHREPIKWHAENLAVLGHSTNPLLDCRRISCQYCQSFLSGITILPLPQRHDLHSPQGGPFHAGTGSSPHPNINRFKLPGGEYVSCVFWNGLYHMTGTDIGELLWQKHV